MTQNTTIDLGHVARDLNLPTDLVERTVELLDEGNTVPFITRYRKDQTGGFDEEQIREIQFHVGKIRQLADRKATILKTIEAQGQLTPELAEAIQHANTPKRLEDLYLPFKPKKQTLATVARERGLEPLAREIFEAHETAADLQARATAFLNPEKEVNTVEDVLAGVGHLMAERFSENAELRGRLRRIFQRSGKIVCTKVETPPPAPTAAQEPTLPAVPDGETGRGGEGETVGSQEPGVVSPEGAPESPPASPVLSTEYSVPSTESTSAAAPTDSSTPKPPDDPAASSLQPPTSDLSPSPSFPVSESPPLPQSPSPAAPDSEIQIPKSEIQNSSPALPTGRLFEAPPAPVAAPLLSKKKKKKKKKVIGEHAFKDYYDYHEPLGRVPPHRVLAINRGERAHAIRVKIEADSDAMLREAEQFLIGNNHPHGEFIRGVVRDSLTRLIMPSLERELRREMTERSEEHAVEVFVRNLRKLLLQPPIRGRRTLAIDPGFKSGSKMAALDEFGNVLGHGMIFVIGKDEDRKKARTRLADMVKQHNIAVIAIGNGTGCRETEQLVADCLAEELKDRDTAYVIVNEAGASIYSTSPLGREELPQYDALQRGAISIGRRLLDPLSEMVKIHPANLGVGLYQHDIKAKHLKDSLDGVVESCVNFVGVDVNSASPALLRYVSGMNALTARRVYEYRREKGPFKNREDLKLVPGFGDQTYVQAAGFLKVTGGENPLDATWIHPESYDIARRVLEKIGCDVSELAKVVPAPPKEEPKKEFAAELRGRETGDRSQEPAAEGAQSSEAGDQETVVEGQPSSVTDGKSLPPSAVDSVLSTQYSVPSTESPAAEPSDSSTASSPSVTDPSPAIPDSPTAESPTAESPASESPASIPQSAISNPQSSPPLPLSPSPPPAAAAPRNLIAERAATVDIRQLAAELSVGTHLLRDIINSLTRPALDPREGLSPPVFRRGIMKLEDLAAGMELSGTVLNVVDFGVFVDIGLSDSGLVHISRLADRFIRDPHEVVGVGDVLKVWVVDVDKSRRRVSLTAIAPGSERPQGPPRERQERQQRPPRQPRRREGGPPSSQGAPPPQPHIQTASGSSPPQQGQRDQHPRAPTVAVAVVAVAVAVAGATSAAAAAPKSRIPKPSSARRPSPRSSSRSPRPWKQAKNPCAPSPTSPGFSTRKNRSRQPQETKPREEHTPDETPPTQPPSEPAT